MENENQEVDYRLFWGCFIALIATAFGFIIRALIIGDWGDDFNLTETQKGELLGLVSSIDLVALIADGRARVD